MATESASGQRAYVMYGGEQGAARLRILGIATRATTIALLARAGIRPGMRVLDLGCGSGEVSVELAAMVAPTGRVTGIDGDAAVLEFARAKASAHAHGAAITFVQADALGPYPESDYDAVYARFLLSHLRDPAAALARVRAALVPGGLIAVEDIDFAGHFCEPPSAAFARFVELYTEAAQRRGANPMLGPRLPGLLTAAGFTDVAFAVVQPAFRDGEGKRMAQLTVEAIRAAAVGAGLTTDAEIDRLIDELDAHRRAPDTIQSLPRIFQAWGTSPS